ncbi:hypothetical protein ACWGQ2_05105 [Arthrobacter sp. NPDC055585]
MSTTRPTDPKEPPRTAVTADEQRAPVPPGQPLPPGAAAQVSSASPRRSAGIRLRQAAASSVLAAVSVTGVGTAAAQASGPQEASVFLPSGDDTALTVAAVQDDEVRQGAERLAGVRQDLANAVAWGSVTASQAEHFYAQISSRIARGL